MRKSWLAASAAFLVLGTSATASSQTPNQVPEAPAVIDPLTISALQKMGTALRSLDSFTVQADTTDEKVLTNGQKVQFSGYVETRAKLPNSFRIERISDRQERILFYDGKVVTLYSPRMGLYGTAPMTGPIQEVVAAVAEKYDLETPLADLFSWGADSTSSARLQSAVYIGAQTIGGIACDQYAMREADVDWQVWIPQKGDALPCKLVITATDQPSMPQYSAVFKWKARQAHPRATFTFVPPKGSHEIPLGKAPPQTASAQ